MRLDVFLFGAGEPCGSSAIVARFYALVARASHSPVRRNRGAKLHPSGAAGAMRQHRKTGRDPTP